MEITENWFDIAFAVTVLMFAFLAFLKGFVKELFSIFNILAAIFLSQLIAPFSSQFLPVNVYSSAIFGSIVQIVLFVISLMVISIFTSSISSSLNERMPLFINQPLGFVFGFAKGYLIIALIFAITTTVYSYGIIPMDKESKKQNIVNSNRVGPYWLTSAVSYDIAKYGADFLQPIVNFSMAYLKDSSLKKKLGSTEDILNKIDKLQKVSKGEALNEDEKSEEEKIIDQYYEEEGYEMQDIYKMKNLIETIN